MFFIGRENAWEGHLDDFSSVLKTQLARKRN